MSHHGFLTRTRRTFLVTASGAAGSISGLGVGSTLLGLLTLGHHLLEVDVATSRVLVSRLAGVSSGAIRGVTIPGLEGVEVVDGSGGVGVPGIVDRLLGLIVPKLAVVRAHLHEESRRRHTLRRNGGKGRGGGNSEGGNESLEHL